ncbi:MAG: hypothetical protein LBJ10_04590 [Clostridiales bacterium]|nr:hypothetical protein [Clostridiales bacterium]
MSFVNSNWYIAAAFCFVFFIGGRQLGEAPGATRRAKRLARLLLLAFALPSLLFPAAALFDFLRLAPWYNTFRAVNRIELLTAMAAPFAGYATYMGAGGHGDGGYAVGGGGRGRAAVRRAPTLKGAMKPLAFPLSLLLVSINFAEPLIMPLSRDTVFSDRWAGGILMQPAPSGSGPAALATAMNSANGYEGGERDIFKHTYTDRAGTEFWHLARYAAEKGYRCSFQLAYSAKDIPTPSVAYISAAAAARRGDAAFADAGALPGTGAGTGGMGAAGANRAMANWIAAIGGGGLGAFADGGDAAFADAGGLGAAGANGSAANGASGGGGGNAAPAGYYVALLGNSGGKLTVGDPQRGRAELTYGEFLDRYPYSGLVLAISAK